MNLGLEPTFACFGPLERGRRRIAPVLPVFPVLLLYATDPASFTVLPTPAICLT